MASPVDTATAIAVGIGETVIRPFRPAAGPATERWGIGLGELAASMPRLPGLVRAVARQLNRFGAVAVSSRGIEYDGDEVAWSKVTEIRTRRLVGYLLTGAVAKQVDRLPVWWFPGRGLVLGGLTQAALTAVAVVGDLHLDSGVFTVYIPAEVRSRGLFGSGQLAPGIPAALVLADPAVRDFVAATAEAHGIPVRPADDDALEVAVRRATAIRAAVGMAAAAIFGQAGTRSSA